MGVLEEIENSQKEFAEEQAAKERKRKMNAERQAKYRASRDKAGNSGIGEKRINMWVDGAAFYALERLAKHNGLTQKQMLERLLDDADKAAIATLGAARSEAWEKYFAVD